MYLQSTQEALAALHRELTHQSLDSQSHLLYGPRMATVHAQTLVGVPEVLLQCAGRSLGLGLAVTIAQTTTACKRQVHTHIVNCNAMGPIV